MKRKVGYVIESLLTLTMALLLTSCAICTRQPLTDINEVHNDLLIGTWKSSSVPSSNDIYTIRDEGKYYIAEHNKNKSKYKLTLTKLNNRYFISVICNETSFIWMIHVDKEKLILYTLPSPTWKKIFGQNDITKISNAELRKLCAEHVDDFSVEIQKFVRISSHVREKGNVPTKNYYDFLKEFFAYEASLPKLGNSQSDAIEFGNKLQYAAEQMYNVISRYNLPEAVQDAAIDYVKSISDAGKTFRAAPYIPSDEADAFLTGFFKGLAGDITGGTMEVSQWQNEIRRKIETVQSKHENLKIIMIKHGVKY